MSIIKAYDLPVEFPESVKKAINDIPDVVSEKDKKYDYAEMTRDLRKIAHKYPGKTGLPSLGRTYDNREIWCLRVGNPSAAKKLVAKRSRAKNQEMALVIF